MLDQGVKYSIEASTSINRQGWKRHVATWRSNPQLNNLFAASPYFFSIRVLIVLRSCTLISYIAAWFFVNSFYICVVKHDVIT